jgi:hypothetical protein
MITLRSAALLCILALAPSSPAFAEIYSSNDPTIKVPTDGVHFVTGTGNLTIDSISGLAWLDLTLTTNMSCDDIEVERQYGKSLWGYRLATALEVQTLWADAGIEDENWNLNEDSVHQWDLQEIWGVTDSSQDAAGPLHFIDHAITSTVDPFLLRMFGETWMQFATLENHTGKSVKDLAAVNGATMPSARALDYAPALVQDASVPEPSALMLATLGLLGGYAMVRVQRRRRTSTPQCR